MTGIDSDEDVSVGFDDIDSEHRLQLRLLSALREAVAEGPERADVDEIFDRLIEFTKVHFTSEQLLMRLYGDPGYDAHVQEHERTVEQIEALRERYRSGGTPVAVDSIDALARGLIAHIRRSNRTLGSYLARLRVQDD